MTLLLESQHHCEKVHQNEQISLGKLNPDFTMQKGQDPDPTHQKKELGPDLTRIPGSLSFSLKTRAGRKISYFSPTHE